MCGREKHAALILFSKGHRGIFLSPLDGILINLDVEDSQRGIRGGLLEVMETILCMMSNWMENCVICVIKLGMTPFFKFFFVCSSPDLTFPCSTCLISKIISNSPGKFIFAISLSKN